MEVFYKKLFLKISQKSQKNTSARVSFLIKLQDSSTLVLNDLCDTICMTQSVFRFSSRLHFHASCMEVICTEYYSAFQGLNKISQQQAAAAVLTCTNFREKQVKEEETKKKKIRCKTVA